MPPSFVSLVRATLLALLLCGQAASAADPAPPIASFFENPAFGGARLSPSAKYLAARSGKPGLHDFLVVIDLQANSAKVVASFTDADVGHFEWVNDERLLFDVTDKDVAPGDQDYGPGLYAVDRDGGSLRQLAERSGGGGVVAVSGMIRRELLPWHTFMLGQRGAQDSEYVYVQSPEWDATRELRHVDLLRLNTRTGHAQPVRRPGQVRSWLLDHKGEPRIAVTSERDTVTVFYLDPAGAGWRRLASYPAFGTAREKIEPLGFGPDGTLFVEANNGKDTSAVYTFNVSTGQVNPEPVVVAAGYDFDGELVADSRKVLGVRFTTDAESNAWFDPEMKSVQQAVDKLLPATNNLISVAARAEQPWVLVRSWSDVEPPRYALFDTRSGRLNPVGRSFAAIDGAQMAHQKPVRYKARDGLEIPALLTMPNGPGKQLPLVMLVHGGPWVRGPAWGWNPETQFLASRGYAVLEPAYRGSTGLGTAHFTAGFRQWGLAMQDDIADGARWAIAQGIADPKRICIAGASYGGYATLMGLVNDPGLYRCGVDWVGVTDINLMYTGTWYGDSDLSREYRAYGMPAMVGDPDKDAAQLKATSPIEQAARITQPVLLAYGGADRRVPIFHGRRFYDAVRRTNPHVEWVEYPEEGHGWTLPKNRIDFWSRVERFLAKNIGGGEKIPE